MEVNEIYQGDALEVLRTWPDEFVDCCITSPPYWGLRDYGTATWEGGDENCDHKEGDKVQGNPEFNENRPSRELTSYQFKNICGKCGAKRIDQQLGLEKTPEEYVAKLVEIFREVKRCLKSSGVVFLNLGDSYFSSGTNMDRNWDGRDKNFTKGKPMIDLNHPVLKQKDLVGVPWRVAFALQADGWYLRQDIIWAKPNPMPESVTDRCTKSHEYIFLLTKSPQYYFDNEAIKEKSVLADPRMVDGFVPKSVNGKHKDDKQNSDHRKQYKPTEAGGGTSMLNHSGYFKSDGNPIGDPGTRNKRSVWTVTTSPYPEAHFATYPPELITPCVLAGCPPKGIILDPFMGAGTTGLVAKQAGRNYLGIELNPSYIEIANKRLNQQVLDL